MIADLRLVYFSALLCFASQLDNTSFPAKQDCGPRAVLSVLRRMELDEDLSLLADEIQPAGAELSSLAELKDAISRRGLAVYPLRIGRHWRPVTNNPMVVHMQTEGGEGHFAVLVKLYTETEDQSVSLDMGDGTLLEGEWQDIFSLCSPEVLVIARTFGEDSSLYFRRSHTYIETILAAVSLFYAIVLVLKLHPFRKQRRKVENESS